MQDGSTTQIEPQSAHQARANCFKCGYDISTLDPTCNCPECGSPNINGCIGCAYDLTETPSDSNCPECGVPVWCSVGRNALRKVGSQELTSVHAGFRLATQLILFYIIASIISGVLFLGVISRADDSTIAITIIAAAIVLNATIFGILLGWFKLSRPLPGIHAQLDAPDRRKFLRTTLWIVVALTIVQTIWAMIPDPSLSDPNAEIRTIDFIAMGFQALYAIAILVAFVAQVMYIGWFAKLVRNRKMERRAKHLIWSGPLIAIIGSFLFMLGPLIALILYWNLIEYVRRDLKKIIKARN